MAAEESLARAVRQQQSSYDVERDAVHRGSRSIKADNDNPGSDTELRALDLSALARQAAWGLVEYHQSGNPVEIRARGTADRVFEDLTKQFMSYGTNRVIAENLAQALVDEAIERADEFRSKVKQKYIAVSAIVADAFREDMYQFETGHTEVIVIDKNSADIAGSSGQEVRLTATGTATTSNRADVGQIFASIKKTALYIVQEAPGKEEIDGVEAEAQAALAAALEAIGAEMGAGMDAEGLRAIMEQLQELGVMTPEIESMLATLVVMSEYAADLESASPEMREKIEAEIAKLSKTLMEQMSAALESGDIPLPLLQGMGEYLNNLAQEHGLESVIDLSSLSEIRRDIQKAVVIQKLEALAEGLDGDARAELDALIEELGAAEGADIIKQLSALEEKLETLGLSAEQLEAITGEISKLDQMTMDTLSLDQKMEILAELSADDLMALLEELDGLDPSELPPELAELLEQLDVENMTIEQLKEALAGQGELAETVQKMILMLNDPDIQAALPASVLPAVTDFVNSHRGFVEAVTVQATITELQSRLEGIDPESPEASEITKMIEALADTGKLDAVAAEVATYLPPALVRNIDSISTPEMPSPITVLAAATGAKAVTSTKTFSAAPLPTSTLSAPPPVSFSSSAPPTSPPTTVPVTSSPATSSSVSTSTSPTTKTVSSGPINIIIDQLSKPAGGNVVASAVNKAIAQNLQIFLETQQQLNHGRQVSGKEINRALDAIDTALGNPNLPQEKREALLLSRQDLVNDVQAKGIEGTDPEKLKQPGPGNCGIDCQCGSKGPFDKNAARSNDGPVQLSNGRAMESRPDGSYVITDKNGDVVKTITAEQVEHMNLLSEQIYQKYREKIDYDGAEKALDELVKNGVHVCTGNCDHGSPAGKPAPMPPDMKPDDYARIAKAMAGINDTTSDISTFIEGLRSDGSTDNPDFTITQEHDEELKKLFETACEGDCGDCGACDLETPEQEKPEPEAKPRSIALTH